MSGTSPYCPKVFPSSKLQLAIFRGGEYTLALPQSPEQCLQNEYTSQYCYFLDAQVIRGVLVYDPFRSSFSCAFRIRLSHCKLYEK